MIHPDWYQDESGIVLVKANPPFIARNEYIRRQKNRDAKPFRLRNVYTDCFLTAEPGVADEVYVVLEPATGRRVSWLSSRLEFKTSQLWRKYEDSLCSRDTFRIVPVAFPRLTLRVHESKKVLVLGIPTDEPTIGIDKTDKKKEAENEHWEMMPAHMGKPFDLCKSFSACSACCKPSASKDDEISTEKHTRGGGSVLRTASCRLCRAWACRTISCVWTTARSS